ncbi:MAG: class I SAM-dependent methyltransferase [Candidatus Thorarchaeota archaeon]
MSHQEIRDRLRVNLLEFTRAAFKILPSMDKPSILDIGCGSGLHTIEIAKMCNGHLTAVDIDVPALVTLKKRIKDLGLSDRISVRQASMRDLNRVSDTYDIIWAEGSIFVVGFEKGIRDWKRLLSKDGYLVVHDEDAALEQKIQIIKKHEYRLRGQIRVPHEDWEERYYKPLLSFLSKKKLAPAEENRLRKEIDTFKRTRMGSVFFILQNKSKSFWKR